MNGSNKLNTPNLIYSRCSHDRPTRNHHALLLDVQARKPEGRFSLPEMRPVLPSLGRTQDSQGARTQADEAGGGMRELSLFTGAGGGLLGTKLLGWEPIGYVEWNKYCQQVIAARVRDGFLPVAPIFTDVREFVQSGAARQYRGFADVVSAGFPCQPFSVAGKQLGADDSRNMWPETADVIRIVQPKSVLLENVPGLISAGYIGTVIGDLADLGYVGKWGVIGASDVGAPHRRKRLWVVAHTKSEQRNGGSNHAGKFSEPSEVSEFGNSCREANVADTNSAQREGMRSAFGVRQEHTNACGASVAWWSQDPADDVESGVGRMVDGLASRVVRLKVINRLQAIGNGQVPFCAAKAWELLA